MQQCRHIYIYISYKINWKIKSHIIFSIKLNHYMIIAVFPDTYALMVLIKLKRIRKTSNNLVILL